METPPQDVLNTMPKWQQMQYKSFKAWCNYNLKGFGEIGPLSTAFRDGLLLAHLLETISGEKIKGIKPDPKFRIHYINNLFSCFTFLRAVPIPLYNMQPEDIADGNIKLILGLVWMLILHYQIQQAADENHEAPPATATVSQDESVGAAPVSEKPVSSPAPVDPRSQLASRINKMFKDHDFRHEIHNFTADWQDGLSLLAMVYCEDPTIVDFEACVDNDPMENLQLAFSLLEKHWGVPRLLDAEDLVSSKPDEKAMMTYVSVALDCFDSGERRKVTPKSTPKSSMRAAPLIEPLTAPVVEPVSTPVAEPLPTPAVEPLPTPAVESLPPLVESLPAPPSLPVPQPEPEPVAETATFQQPEPVLVRQQSVLPEPSWPLPVPSPVIRAQKAASSASGSSSSSDSSSSDSDKDNALDNSSGSNLKADRDFEDEQEPPVLQMADVSESGEPVVIHLRVAGARDLKGCDILRGKGKADPYCKIKVKGQKIKKQKTPVIKKTLNPEWNSEYTLQGPGLTRSRKLLFTISDWDIITKNDLMGTVTLPVDDIFENPVFDKWLPITGKDKSESGHGELHIVAVLGKDATLPAIYGEPLVLRLCAGRNLMAADRSGFSDPYVILTNDNPKTNRNMRTSVEKKTLNPVWNQKFIFQRAELNEDNTLTFNVRDWDRVGKDDPLGYVNIPVAAFAAEPVFDRWLPIADGKGELHIQAAFGDSATLPDKPASSMPVQVRVGRARNLRAADKDGFSDPFCQVSLAGIAPDPKFKTAVVKGTLNPVWNQDFQLPAAESHDVLQFDLYDWDRVTANEPLGYAQLPLGGLNARAPVIETWLPLFNAKTHERERGEVQVAVAFGEGAFLPSVNLGEPLQLRIAEAKNLLAADRNGKSDPYCVLLVAGTKGSDKKTKAMKKTLNPVWNEEFGFAPGELDAEHDVLRFALFDKDIGSKDESLGTVDLPLKPLTAGNPVQDLWLPVTIKTKKGDETQGQLRVQLAYGPAVHLPPPADEEDSSSSSDDDSSSSDSESEAEREFVNAPIKVRVVAARHLKVSDNTGTSDPYCVIEVKGKKSKKRIATHTVKKTLNPVWDAEFDLDHENIHPTRDVLTFAVMDWDRVGKNDFLGKAQLGVKELMTARTFDKWLPLEDSSKPGATGLGEIHIVASYDCDLPVQEKVYLPLKLRIVAGRHLLACDKSGSSDPFVVIELPRRKKEQQLRTRVIKQSLSPVWNEDFNLGKEGIQPDDVLRLNVFDWDQVGKNDPMGHIDLDIDRLATKPITDEWYPIHNGTGEIHIMSAMGDVQFPAVPTPRGKSKVSEQARGAGDGADGVLKVRIVAGRDLLSADTNGKSDPYCMISVEGKKIPKELKTKTIKETLNPVWNEEFELGPDVFDPRVDTVRFALMDWDRVGTDDPLGSVWLDGKLLLGSPELNKWFPVMNKPGVSGKGDLHIHISYGPKAALPPVGTPADNENIRAPAIMVSKASKKPSKSSSGSSSSSDSDYESEEKETETPRGKNRMALNVPDREDVSIHSPRTQLALTPSPRTMEEEDGSDMEGYGPAWSLLKTFWNYNKARNFKGLVRRMKDADNGDLQFSLRTLNDSHVSCNRITIELVALDDTAKKRKKFKTYKEIELKKKDVRPGHKPLFNSTFTYPRPKKLSEFGTHKLLVHFHFRIFHTQQPLEAGPLDL